MTPAARVQAAVEVLDDILQGAAAEQALTRWARRSRFAGSKDRRAVRDHVYQVLRARRSYAALGGALTGRGLMIGLLRAGRGPLDALFSGEGYGPAPLTDEEKTGTPLADSRAKWNLPDWLIDAFQTSLGEEARQQATALTERAPVMLRVNLRKISRREAVEALARDGIVARPDGIADTALLVEDGAARIGASVSYRSGLVELQDGASQAAMAQLEVPPGAKVLDYCAGGGGKTLALAARHDARWFAHDVDRRRMGDLAPRAARAGVSVTELASETLMSAAPFGLILCDAPCSGSGTWRRTPDAKWALTPARLDELVALQARILDEAAGLVAKDGRLAYLTCSVLDVENEKQIQSFMRRNSSWNSVSRMRWPISGSGDGFFLAQLVRAG